MNHELRNLDFLNTKENTSLSDNETRLGTFLVFRHVRKKKYSKLSFLPFLVLVLGDMIYRYSSCSAVFLLHSPLYNMRVTATYLNLCYTLL
jgi:hypothetical protein